MPKNTKSSLTAAFTAWAYTRTYFLFTPHILSCWQCQVERTFTLQIAHAKM